MFQGDILWRMNNMLYTDNIYTKLSSDQVYCNIRSNRPFLS